MSIFKNVSNAVDSTANGFADFAHHNKPVLSGWLGIVGYLAAIALTVPATLKAERAINEKKQELGKETLTPKETLMAIAAPAIPVVTVAGCATIASIDSINEGAKRTAEWVAMYELKDLAFREYKEKTKQIIGEKKEQKIRDEIAQDKIDQNPPQANVNVYMPESKDGNYKVLHYEPILGFYYWDYPKNFDGYFARAVNYKNGTPFEELNAYEWLTYIPPLKRRLEELPDGKIQQLMREGWGRDYPHEGFCANVDWNNPRTVHGGEWDGYPCFDINYDSFPIPYY